MHALRPYWSKRGYLTAGVRVAEQALARPALQARDFNRCVALFTAGQLSFFMGRHADAQAHLQECLAIARETGNATVVARVLQPLGTNCVALHDYEAARGHLDEALAMAREQGHALEIYAAELAMAMLLRLLGEHDAAQSLCALALERATGIGDHESAGIALVSLTMIALSRPAPSGAVPLLLRAIDMAEQAPSHQLEASIFDACAGIAAMSRHWADAARFLGSADGRRAEAHLHRDVSDAAFIAPFVAATRQALDEEDFDARVRAGRASWGALTWGTARTWLASVQTGS